MKKDRKVHEVKLKLFLQGWKVEDNTPAALAQRIQSDTALYRALIAKTGIKLDWEGCREAQRNSPRSPRRPLEPPLLR